MGDDSSGHSPGMVGHDMTGLGYQHWMISVSADPQTYNKKKEQPVMPWRGSGEEIFVANSGSQPVLFCQRKQ